MNHKKNFLSIFVLVVSLVVLVVGGLVIWETLDKETSVNSPIIQTDAYYSIRKNATDLQVDLYKQLSDAIDDSKSDTIVAGLVAQNFVADFFTFSNKLSISDIGGLQFIDTSIKTNVYHQAKDTIYMSVIDAFENGTIKDTLEVESVTILTQDAIEYTRLGEEDDEGIREETIVDAIEVTLKWTYVSVPSFNTMDYDQSARIVLTKDSSNRYHIVEVNYVDEEA